MKRLMTLASLLSYVTNAYAVNPPNWFFLGSYKAPDVDSAQHPLPGQLITWDVFLDKANTKINGSHRYTWVLSLRHSTLNKVSGMYLVEDMTMSQIETAQSDDQMAPSRFDVDCIQETVNETWKENEFKMRHIAPGSVDASVEQQVCSQPNRP